MAQVFTFLLSSKGRKLQKALHCDFNWEGFYTEDVNEHPTREKPNLNRAMPLFHHTGVICSDVQSTLSKYLFKSLLNIAQFVEENTASGKGLSSTGSAAG